MIRFLYGDDTDARKSAIAKIIGDTSGDQESLVARFDEANWAERAIMAYSESAGLFDTRYIVLIDRVLEDKDKLSFANENIGRFADSPNTFIFSENKATKELLKLFEKSGAVIENFILTKVGKSSAPSPFLLADAFGRRDKKNTWMLYIKAVMSGESPEAISGMIFWKIKTMLLSGRTKPFEKSELRARARELVSLYHHARGEDGGDLSVALERFILKSL